MSAGLRCVCSKTDHHPLRRPSSLPPEWQIEEPGTCTRYATDQERGGLCAECGEEPRAPQPDLSEPDNYAVKAVRELQDDRDNLSRKLWEYSETNGDLLARITELEVALRATPVPASGLPSRDALDLPEIVDAVMLRRWPSGFSASVSVEGKPSIVSERRWPTWQEAMADVLSQMTGSEVLATLAKGETTP